MKYFFLFFLLFGSLWAKPTYSIAIIEDGNSIASKQFTRSLKYEITQLLSRDFQVTFPKKYRYNGQWNYTKIAHYVNSALQNKNIDMIITLGVLSSHYIARKHSFSKPVIATTILDPHMQHIPYHRGVSGKYNLTYVSAFNSFEQDIKTIKKLLKAKKVAVFADATLLKNTPSIGRFIKKKFKQYHLQVKLVPVGKDLKKALAALSEDIDCVYVTPLFQLSQQQRKMLYDKLRIKEIPSFSAMGEDDVKLGALFANAPASDNKRFIRQIALDVQQIALGSKASEQSVDFVPHPALSLNMKTAKEIGFAPSWELLSSATIIGNNLSDSHFFSIEEIMDRAVAYNLQVIQSKYKVSLSQARLDQADALYLPQIDLTAEAAQVDQDRAVASLGMINESRMDVALSVTQQLFNQRAIAQISINEDFLKAQNRANDFIKLEVALRAATTYLKILQLQTRLKIEKGNLELSKTNLRAARTKLKIGIGNASDIYRWETQISAEKKSLLFTHAALEQTKHSLNALLNLPLDLELNFKPVTLSNPIFMTQKKSMQNYFLDQQNFFPFESFLVATAKQNMPSVPQYKAIVHAKELLVHSNKNTFYMPDIALKGGIKEHFISASNDFRDSNPDRFSDFPYANNTDWEVGIFLHFPLFEGGAKSAKLEASKASLLVAKAEYKDLLNNLEKDVRNSLYQAKASFLSIKLAQEASKSSQKNLHLIKDVYLQGGAGIIDLLDAQNTALRAALVENNTRYGFMRDLLYLQYNIGQVNFHMKNKDWNIWKNNLTHYMIQIQRAH